MASASTQVVVQNPLGLHARPAMAFVDAASGYQSEVRVSKGEQTVDGKSIMQLMMLAAVQGTELEITAEGPDADDAVAALGELAGQAS
ncbi:MAG: HPr family phosphocarrier protein [Planctomycetota bacterium]